MDDAASVSRSQRYKVAMTARARQRRMRRMKDKQQRAEADAKPSSDAASDADSYQSSVSVQSADNVERSASKSSTTCETKSSKPAALLLPPNSKMVTPEQQQPKRTTTTVSTSRSIKSRYERGLSTKRRGTATTMDTAAADTTSCAPIKLNSVPSIQQVPTASPTTVLTVPPCSSINHLLPNSDALHLSPDEIRDATNFTSVQFSCSTDGEVEIMGDADYCTDDDNNNTAHGRNDAMFMNNVWDTAAENVNHLERENDICFKKEAAGIVGLLTPEKMVKAGLMAPDGDNTEDDETPDISGDSPTGITSLHNSTSNLTFFPDDPASSRDVTTWHGVRPINNTAQQQSNDNKQHKETMKLRMIQPSSQLAELLSQINRNANSTPKLHRAYVTRRKNACGALKILSAKLENRLKIAWTVGVLDALASVLRDVTTAVPDNHCNVANIEGRNRAVATLLNLSTHKKNRMLISSHEGLMTSILSCIEHDEGESRQGCCTVLLYLAKTAESRPLLLQCPGLIEVLARVIDVKRVRKVATTITVKKKSYQNRFLKEFEMAADGITAGAADKNNAVNTMIDTVEEGLSESEDDSSSVGSSNGLSSGSDTNADESGSEDETEDEGDEDKQNEAMDGLSPKRMEICFKTPQQESVVDEVDYDADPNRFLHGARLSIFAALLCLVKNKENAFDIARAESVIQALIGVSKKHNSPSHPRAIAILAHLTRSPRNSHHLVFKYTELLPMLQNATSSNDNEARRYALCAIQNLSMDKSCRAPIAHTPNMIASLVDRCKSDEKEEVLAAVASLQNLSDEPANLITFTTVKNCIVDIIALAKSDRARMNEGIETKLTQFMARNTLATISFWFRKIATSGIQKDVRTGGSSVSLYEATLQPTGYCMWS